MMRIKITEEQAFAQISESAKIAIANYKRTHKEDADRRYYIEFDDNNIAWAVNDKLPIGTHYFGRIKLPESKELNRNVQN